MNRFGISGARAGVPGAACVGEDHEDHGAVAVLRTERLAFGGVRCGRSRVLSECVLCGSARDGTCLCIALVLGGSAMDFIGL